MTVAKALTLLVVDDEPPIRRFLRTSLVGQGYHVVEAATGSEGLSAIQTERPDVVILDLGLPDIDGVGLIRIVRRTSQVPIIILSSRDDEWGKVEALDLGADDYITKPFGMDELMARVRAALRHRLLEQGEPAAFASGDLRVDLVRRLVHVRGEEVKLSPREFDILQILVRHAGKVLTHKFIIKEVWKVATDVQYLRIYVKQLRRKIEADPQQPRHIVTETGVGYRLRIQD